MRSEAVEVTFQRSDADESDGFPSGRSSQSGTPEALLRSASRLVAVKSNACGFPQISPTTADKAVHPSPSSIAQSASTARFVATRSTDDRRPNPSSPRRHGGPISCAAQASWIHRTGPGRFGNSSNCVSIKPVAAASCDEQKISVKAETGSNMERQHRESLECSCYVLCRRRPCRPLSAGTSQEDLQPHTTSERPSSRVSVCRARSSGRGGWSVVSTMDGGHSAGFSHGATAQAALDRRGEAFDLPADACARRVGGAGGPAICGQRQLDLQVAARRAPRTLCGRGGDDRQPRTLRRTSTAGPVPAN